MVVGSVKELGEGRHSLKCRARLKTNFSGGEYSPANTTKGHGIVMHIVIIYID